MKYIIQYIASHATPDQSTKVEIKVVDGISKVIEEVMHIQRAASYLDHTLRLRVLSSDPVARLDSLIYDSLPATLCPSETREDLPWDWCDSRQLRRKRK